MSIGFDRDRGRRQKELTSNRNMKGKNPIIIMPKDVFGFAEHQEKANCGLGYKITLGRNSDKSVLIQDVAMNIVK